MFHIDSLLFRDFHHVTRWKLIVFSTFDIKSGVKIDVLLLKYVSFDEESCVVTEMITIEHNSEKTYPTKHLNNRLNLYPPNLFQQALHFIIKDRYQKHMIIY